MKQFFKILFFLLAVFYRNISEAKAFILIEVVSETKSAESVVENKNESVEILENDFVKIPPKLGQEIKTKKFLNLLDYDTKKIHFKIQIEGSAGSTKGTPDFGGIITET